MAGWSILPLPIDCIPVTAFGSEDYLEIHLDERYNMGENIQICKVWIKNNDGDMIIENKYKAFYDADQCVNFITSCQWRKVFLTLTDKFSYLIELIHNLPQVVYVYIYSASPMTISYKTEQYPKLRTIVQENSPDTDNQLLDDIEMFTHDLMPIYISLSLSNEKLNY